DLLPALSSLLLDLADELIDVPALDLEIVVRQIAPFFLDLSADSVPGTLELLSIDHRNTPRDGSRLSVDRTTRSGDASSRSWNSLLKALRCRYRWSREEFAPSFRPSCRERSSGTPLVWSPWSPHAHPTFPRTQPHRRSTPRSG